MTEKEVLQQQETNGQKEFYLMAVGMFYHAYGCGAFALARATGYRVLRKQRRYGDVLVCGFPANQLDTVLKRIREAGGEVDQTSEKVFLFRGLDGTADVSLIAETKPQTVTSPTKNVPQSETSFSWLVDELLSFNLSLSTPMDAMNLCVLQTEGTLDRPLCGTGETARLHRPSGYGLAAEICRQ